MFLLHETTLEYCDYSVSNDCYPDSRLCGQAQAAEQKTGQETESAADTTGKSGTNLSALWKCT